MGDYVSVAELRAACRIVDSEDDGALTAAIDAAERQIDTLCGRRFVLEATATARRFRTDPYSDVLSLGESVVGSTSGLVIATDTSDDGTFATTIASTDYQLEPIDGLGPDGRTGWPYTSVRRLDAYWPYSYAGRPAVRVTARWGWATCPTPVRTAALLLAEEIWKLPDAPFGVAQFSEFGLRVRDNPRIVGLLAPFRAGTSIVGIA